MHSFVLLYFYCHPLNDNIHTIFIFIQPLLFIHRCELIAIHSLLLYTDCYCYTLIVIVIHPLLLLYTHCCYTLIVIVIHSLLLYTHCYCYTFLVIASLLHSLKSNVHQMMTACTFCLLFFICKFISRHLNLFPW